MVLLRVLQVAGCCLLFFGGYALRKNLEAQKLYLSTKAVNHDISHKWIEISRMHSDQYGLYITQQDLFWREDQ